ncbi:hypothetical protein CS542_08220 [Pedobacter sp. IW39]|nr:hypothetical protein CS542_08220 [Pedobacter sp. IW39]
MKDGIIAICFYMNDFITGQSGVSLSVRKLIFLISDRSAKLFANFKRSFRSDSRQSIGLILLLFYRFFKLIDVDWLSK